MSEGVSLPIEGEAITGEPGDPTIRLTDLALQKVRELLKRDGAEGHGLRIGVTGGGCSGMQYQLAFEPAPKAGDLVLELDGARVFVDPASQPHLAGLTLDYVTGLNGAGFKFLNPNATRTCGCGTSFAV
jgi:iron-sulfur cluster assembly accessory protein